MNILKQLSLLLVGCGILSASAQGVDVNEESIRKRPPMGWNSYTGYANALGESELIRNIDTLDEKLKRYGYDTVVIDAGWFLEKAHPKAKVIIDEYGRPECSPHFFPNGLKPVIDYAHKKNLKFGLWLIRGVDRGAVHANLPIKGTDYRLQDIVDKKNVCGWVKWNYGVDMSKPGAQEYYDSMIEKYAEWGVDFIKYDDIVPHPAEIEAVVKAIEKCGRKIVLSLSPGDHIQSGHDGAYKKADMVRITHDIWDNMKSLNSGFKRWEEMQDYDGPKTGSFIDLDMICFGRLFTFNNQWSPPIRQCEFTPDQKRTFMAQRALAASPLMLGGILYDMDDFSMSLFTNEDIIRCNQNGVIGKLVHRKDRIDVWKTPQRDDGDKGWIGVFNRKNNAEGIVNLQKQELGLRPNMKYRIKDAWSGEELPDNSSYSFRIPADGVAFLSFEGIQSVK